MYWYTANKEPLIALTLFGLSITGLVYAVYALINSKMDTRNLTCLALNVYHEARGEPEAGQYAVAKVTLNRVASKHYPNTICTVVYQKNWDRIRRRYVSAFSWTELPPVKTRDQKSWRRAWRIAETVYEDPSVSQLGGALFYHAKTIKPSWARRKKIAARIGKHIFY